MIHYTMTGISAGLPFCGIAKNTSEAIFQHMGYGSHPVGLCEDCQAIADAPLCLVCDEIQVYNLETKEYSCPDCKR